MHFHTSFDIPQVNFKIGIQTKIVSIGSCFADSIGEKLSKYKFKIVANPLGIIYNPVSMTNILTGKINQLHYTCKDEIWYCYDCHSKIYSRTLDETRGKVNHMVDALQRILATADTIIITWGTAWVYKLKSTGEVVANCHKSDSQLFDKVLLDPEEIVASFAHMYNYIRQLRPKIQIILTISPVRHIKDTIPLNHLSKSVLSLACYHLINRFPDVYYFPSYEIMMDDLRDYRFYKEDMIHPNDMAINYIWDKWMNWIMDEKTLRFIQDWTSIMAALDHRPFHPESKSHQEFIRQTILRIQPLSRLVDVKDELDFLNKQLI